MIKTYLKHKFIDDAIGVVFDSFQRNFDMRLAFSDITVSSGNVIDGIWRKMIVKVGKYEYISMYNDDLLIDLCIVHGDDYGAKLYRIAITQEVAENTGIIIQ
jgi:hypothetical protein